MGIKINQTNIYQLTIFDEVLATTYLEFNSSETIFGTGVAVGWMYAIEVQSINYSETLETPINTTIDGWKLESLYWDWTNDSNDFTNSTITCN